MTNGTEVPTGETPEQRDITLNKDMAAFGYIWILSLAVFWARRDSSFVRFHSKQGIVLFLLTIPAWLIPGLGRILILLLAAGMVLGFINAAQGKKTDVPFIGPLSRGELKFQDITDSLKRWMRDAKAHWKTQKKEPPSPPPSTVPPPPSVATDAAPSPPQTPGASGVQQ